jgi:hypothetical protein
MYDCTALQCHWCGPWGVVVVVVVVVGVGGVGVGAAKTITLLNNHKTEKRAWRTQQVGRAVEFEISR